MKIQIILEFLVILGALAMGARAGGVGLGLWGAVGLLVLDFVLFVKARAGTLPASDSSGRIQHTPGVCGGEACIGMTRIAVWMLEEARRAGVGDLELLKDYPGISVFDLDDAWQYVETHREENVTVREPIRQVHVLSLGSASRSPNGPSWTSSGQPGVDMGIGFLSSRSLIVSRK